jgi:ABC-type transport system involved in multi-copper enzyme maturation permease subunit
MNSLIKIELKRNNVKTYFIASVIICIVMTGFLFLFAYAPQIDPDPDLQIFAGYDNLISMFSILNMAVFATLSSIMYTRFVIDEYKDKRAILLFSYPIKRGKVMFAKLAVVSLFTLSSMVVCNILTFGIFSISESIIPLVNGDISAQLWLRVVKVTFIMAVTAASIGVVAAGIGFIKKSIPTTIVSAVLLSSLFCNVMFSAVSNASKSDAASFAFMSIVIVAGIISAFLLMRKVKTMEV